MHRQIQVMMTIRSVSELNSKSMLLPCRLMLANKAVRFFVAVYAVLLHLFVFGVVYYSAWSGGSMSASTGLNK